MKNITLNRQFLSIGRKILDTDATQSKMIIIYIYVLSH